MVLALAYAGAALSRTRLAGGGKERKRLIQRGTRLKASWRENIVQWHLRKKKARNQPRLLTASNPE
jgi:hypothetical protein